MWLFCGGTPDKCAFIYQYHPTRCHHVAHDFFEDFKGYIHADCYATYNNINKKIPYANHAGCNAHNRRGYFDNQTIKRRKALPTK
tara:strand:+ start:450 stop:704 length:255 start_codon:yes stop_codon:yes gene_type:complete